MRSTAAADLQQHQAQAGVRVLSGSNASILRPAQLQGQSQQHYWPSRHARGLDVARSPSSAVSGHHLRCRAIPQPPGSGISLFPAGSKQAQVALPALLVQVESSDVVSSTDRGEEVGRAVSAGATGVILSDASGDGSQLYEAAVRLKGLLRGRAPLLLLDRIDIVQAADADGVLLTDKGKTEHFLGCSICFHVMHRRDRTLLLLCTLLLAGVPTVVAKRMLAASGGGLVGRVVTTAEAATTAAADGANLLLITVSTTTVCSTLTPASGIPGYMLLAVEGRARR
jgi:hypothetical protein